AYLGGAVDGRDNSAEASAGVARLVDYFHALLRERERRARDDLTSLMLRAEHEGERLTRDEVVANCILLLFAGHETTTNLLGNGLFHLLRHPAEAALLRADPSLLHGAVEELLRYDGPVPATVKVATEDVPWSRRTIRRGDMVVPFMASANRDPRQFPDPDTLDVRRQPERHVAFAAGTHFCLGAWLARLEARVVLDTVFRRLPHLALAPGDVRHVAPGDHVIGCLSAFCGTCEYCVAGRPNLCEGEATMRGADEAPRLAKDGEPIAQFVHLSAFAERMLVHENALVRIRRDVPLDRVALIGCAVTTGLGAVFNTARVRAGRTAAVIGCGGIGLSVVQGCRIAGARRIVAVDTVAWKVELAVRLGATDAVNAAEGNPVPEVLEMTAGGVDYAFEAIGTPATVRQAVRMTRKGGTIVMIGVVPAGTSVELPGADIVLREKTILG